MKKLKPLLFLLLGLLQALRRRLRRKPFSGVWATFSFLDDTCHAIDGLRAAGFKSIVTHSPCPRPELVDALQQPESRLPWFSLISGLLGLAAAVVMITWMSLQWVLPVSAKAIVSAYPMIVIGFELLILFAVLGTLLGMLLLGWRESFRTKRPRSPEYRSYDRFTHDRFGVVVSCEGTELETAARILEQHAAEEVVREN